MTLPLGTYASIAPGTYSLATLASAFQTTLNLALGAATHTVVGDPTTETLIVTNGVAVSTTSIFGDNASKVLGLDPALPRMIPNAGGPARLPFSIFLGIPLSVALRVRQVSDMGFITGGTANTGQLIVPLISGYGSYQFLSSDIFAQYLYFEHPSHLIEIQLIDPSSGMLLDFNNGEWEMLIERIEPDESVSKRPKTAE